jgi:hypothetical protein
MAILRCDPNVVGGDNNGSTWEDAYSSLQTAINAANVDDEVWVKEGTFSGATIALATGVLVYGGFNSALTGLGGTVAGRAWETDKTIIDGEDTRRCCQAVSTNGGWRLDGFHLDDGYDITDGGGGFYCFAGADTEGLCTLENLIFTGCSAGTSENGGGVAINGPSFPVALDNVQAITCVAQFGAGIHFNCSQTGATIKNCYCYNCTSQSHGGGMMILNGESIEDCEFDSNISGFHGGGLYCSDSTCTIKNIKSTGNDADARGGGIYTNAASIENCLVAGNDADDGGAGMTLYGDATITLNNATIADNTTESGLNVTGTTTVNAANCIVWGNPVELEEEDTATINITYSCVEGGASGTGNISTTPSFLGTGDDPYDLDSDSTCIDAGDGADAPTLDILGRARYDDENTSNTGTGTPAYTDMGCYEFQGAVTAPQSSIFMMCNF